MLFKNQTDCCYQVVEKLHPTHTTEKLMFIAGLYTNKLWLVCSFWILHKSLQFKLSIDEALFCTVWMMCIKFIVVSDFCLAKLSVINKSNYKTRVVQYYSKQWATKTLICSISFCLTTTTKNVISEGEILMNYSTLLCLIQVWAWLGRQMQGINNVLLSLFQDSHFIIGKHYVEDESMLA